MQQWTPAERAAIVRQYLASNDSQREFSERTGIPERTLRSWIRNYAKPAGTVEQAGAIVRRAIAELQVLLQVVEAAEGGRSADAEPGDDSTAPPPASLPPAAASCRPEPHEQVVIEDTEVADLVRAVRDEIAVGAAPQPLSEQRLPFPAAGQWF